MGNAQNLRRISVILDLDLARYSRETSASTLPRHLDAAAEAFITHLEEVGFKVQKAAVHSSLGYLRYEFPKKLLRGAIKGRRHLKKVV